VTFPMMRNVIAITMMFSLIGSFAGFTLVEILTNGGPLGATARARIGEINETAAVALSGLTAKAMPATRVRRPRESAGALIRRPNAAHPGLLRPEGAALAGAEYERVSR